MSWQLNSNDEVLNGILGILEGKYQEIRESMGDVSIGQHPPAASSAMVQELEFEAIHPKSSVMVGKYLQLQQKYRVERATHICLEKPPYNPTKPLL